MWNKQEFHMRWCEMGCLAAVFW